ncbi:MAG TPA: dihydrolipoamide acetyltransferase family protein [Lichenihabitans sp.]|jgi:2-oxoisovalerate dehydrogenase E2 component (dihydrolipoyl transacylase)|nr:dihydrolipoamide acetyltransferase family protein [Lichenihabitans sp.]
MGTFTFKLPDIGEGTTEAEIAAWHVEVGALIREEDPLLELTTNKATVEVTSPVHGKVLERHGEVGDTRPIGTPLLLIETDAPAARAEEASSDGPHPEPVGEESVKTANDPHAEPNAEHSSRSTASAPRSFDTPPSAAAQDEGTRGNDGRPLASPAVRQAAKDRGIDLGGIAGTGPEGRVTRTDLDRATRPSEAPAEPEDHVTEIKIVGIRRQIAERLQDSTRRIPHFAYVEEVDVTALEALRTDLNAETPEIRLTLLPFLVLALVKALPRFPQINARFDDAAGMLKQHAAIHVGIATQTKMGLLVPVLRHAETLDLHAIAAGIKRLAGGARGGSLKPGELSGSTITLTSLGALGGIASTPVINAPETAIVGVNKIVERPVVLGGQIVVRRMMNLSSSFDHRIVDGFDAASFIQVVKRMLEQPARLFMGNRQP